MATTLKSVDAVIIGMGWTGAILAKELTDAGLNVVALERGPMQDTAKTAPYPKVIDELAYTVRGKIFQPLAKETVTVRHTMNQTAVPYRQHGSFYLGTGVGGAGLHWNGMHWRALPSDLRIRSHYTERYGADFIPEGMQIQDYPVSWDELEPHFMHFEEVCGVSGRAGNVGGRIMAGGNPYEGRRSRPFPQEPLDYTLSCSMVDKAAREVGFNPFPGPASNSKGPYTNPYGVRMGRCNFCGFCENYACYMYSKASPQTTILPVLYPRSNFELRTQAHVLKINLDSTGRQATGVTYVDADGETMIQPADLVLVCAFQMHNVRLLLLSGIGQPYDPVADTGVVGRNFAYQMMGGAKVVMPEGTRFNPFIGAGALTVAMDDFNGDNFDHGPLGFVGGACLYHSRTGGRPIRQGYTLPGAPNWGSAWKKSYVDGYQRVTTISSHGQVQAYRDDYLSLDPNYTDSFGLPLLRITHDFHDNDLKMSAYTSARAVDIGRAMGAESVVATNRKIGSHWDTRVYQTTHTTGGAIMGHDPSNSVINRYLQSWDVPNVFVMGASAFPQNIGYNPTGLVGALTYWSAKAIREQYLKNPGPLVAA